MPVTSGGLVESSVRPSALTKSRPRWPVVKLWSAAVTPKRASLSRVGRHGEVVGDHERVVRTFVGPRTEALERRRREAFDFLPA